MASLPYVQELSKVIVAQITQTIGWHSIQTTPLELLSDILNRYLEELTRQTQRYAELYGRTEPNLDDVALAFGDLNIHIPDLEEYIVNVDSVPCIFQVPKFPTHKDSHLNFLKAGSKEVVTRPVHVHEHLPPIHPQEEPLTSVCDNDNVNGSAEPSTSANHIRTDEDIHMFDIDGDGAAINVIGETTVIENSAIGDSESGHSALTFKKPLEPIGSSGASSVGRPTREIISCMMTTSGFISPAREGKLPDAKKPILIFEDEPPARPSSPPSTFVESTPSIEHVDKKSTGMHGRSDDVKSEPKSENKNGESTAGGSSTGDIKPFKAMVAPHAMGGGTVSTKKKVKHADATALKELKKAKKLSQMKSAKLANSKSRKLNKVLSKLLTKPSKRNALLLESGAALDALGTDMSHLSEEEMMSLKKKLKFQQSLKRKLKKEMQMQKGGSKQVVNADGSGDGPLQKPRKKREPKLSKREQLNIASTSSNAYGGELATPTTHPGRPYPMQDGPMPHAYCNDSSSISVDKEESIDLTGGDQQHFDKLSNEPDKRKLNIFKKISTPSSAQAAQSFDPNTPIARKSNKSNWDGSPWPPLDYTHPTMTPTKAHDMSAPLPDPTLFTSTPYAAGIVAGKKTKEKGLSKVRKQPKIPKEKKVKKHAAHNKQRDSPVEMKIPPPMMMPEQPPMPMFPNMGFLDQFSGPGLIPSNPLIPPAQFPGPAGHNLMPQFPVMPNYSELLSFPRFKRHDARFDDAAWPSTIDFNRNPAHNVRHEMKKEAANMSSAALSNVDSGANALSHVAPFVPQSLLPPDKPLNVWPTSNPHDEAILPKSPKSRKSHESVNTPRSSHVDAYAIQGSSVDHAVPKHQQQQTTIVIDSDEDDNLDSTIPSWSHDNSTADQFPDESKRHSKKIKDKSSTGHNKKDKKDKDGSGIKMKKKKDKKDKSKNKEKDHKDKAALKEEKRRKKKEKDRLAAAAAADADATPSTSMSHSVQNIYTDSMARGEATRDTFDNSECGQDTPYFESSLIPKLTLKLAPSSSSPSSRPSTPDIQISKKSSKSWKKKNKWRPMDDESDKSQSGGDDTNYSTKRDSSPELARISALITRPPKQKSKSPSRKSVGDFGDNSQQSHNTMMPMSSALSTPGRGRPKGSTNSNKSKNKTPKPSSLSTTMGGVNYSEPLLTSVIDASSSSSAPRQTSILQSLDQEMMEDNQVWICPACGRVDDGTPMIGCDGCDAWYHWVCVGIQVPPDQDQDWYCRVCISKKQEIDKKKKRKKKDKKDH